MLDYGPAERACHGIAITIATLAALSLVSSNTLFAEGVTTGEEEHWIIGGRFHKLEAYGAGVGREPTFHVGVHLGFNLATVTTSTATVVGHYRE